LHAQGLSAVTIGGRDPDQGAVPGRHQPLTQGKTIRMSTMLAAKLYEVGEPMRLERVPVPTPRPTDVLVAVKACGVVPNLINVLTHWQTWFPELPLPRLPAIFGLDVAGVIAAVGEQVQNFQKGDRVYVTPGLFCGSCPACAPTTP
jgi:D-arabinose 1-dehydrogenase-like Zn-dependent alcohol dehydrogenase